MFFLIFFLVFYLIAFCFLIATIYNKKLSSIGIISKSLTSICFVGVALSSAIISLTREIGCFTDLTAMTGMELFCRMLPAFLLCLAGDVLLEFNQHDEKKRFFLPGLASFLLGHIGFVIALNAVAQFSWLELIIPTVSVIITFFLTRLKDMDTGKMRPYILLYSFFVAWLLSKGVFIFTNAIQNQSASLTTSIYLAIGSALFFISDVIILFLMFYKKQYKHTRFLNLLTYYAAQLLLALSLLYI